MSIVYEKTQLSLMSVNTINTAIVHEIPKTVGKDYYRKNTVYYRGKMSGSRGYITVRNR